MSKKNTLPFKELKEIFFMEEKGFNKELKDLVKINWVSYQDIKNDILKELKKRKNGKK